MLISCLSFRNSSNSSEGLGVDTGESNDVVSCGDANGDETTSFFLPELVTSVLETTLFLI
jgi:hypothetical protein